LERYRDFALRSLRLGRSGEFVDAREAIALESEFEAERSRWHRKIAAVDTLLEDFPVGMIRTGEVELPPICTGMLGDVGKSLAEDVKYSVVDLVNEALRLVRRQFTAADLADLIGILHPNQKVTAHDLSNPLWYLANSGEIVIVKRGRGRRPNIYVKP